MGRFVVSVILAPLLTFGLFWVMGALISVDYELEEGRAGLKVDWVRLRKDDAPVETKDREPPEREKPDQRPPPPSVQTAKANVDPGAGGSALAPNIDPTEALGEALGAAGGADRDVVPLVEIRPEYPMRARQRGLEGWVTVQFTVSRAGTVKDATVVASHPGRVFDRAALQAIRKWKYNPKIENGQAVERPNQRHTFTFDME